MGLKYVDVYNMVRINQIECIIIVDSVVIMLRVKNSIFFYMEHIINIMVTGFKATIYRNGFITVQNSH